MRRLLLPAVLLSFLLIQAAPEWISRSFDFGTIHEEEGPRSGEFKFVNRGDSPLAISQVRTSCGCTQASYPKGPVAPGDTALISFSYDPSRRPGRFEKSIRVYFARSAEEKNDPSFTQLTISGIVIPGSETLAADYPAEGPGLRMQGKMANLGEIKRGALRHGFLQVFNCSDSPVSLDMTSDSPALTAKMIPDTIGPGAGGILSFCLDTAREPRGGELKYRVEASNPSLSLPASIIRVWATVTDQ